MHIARGWLRFGGAILFVLAIASCSPSIPSASTPGGDPPGATDAAPPTTVPTVSSSDLLSAALDPLRAGSAFDTRIEVDGAVVLSASGRSVGGAIQTTVTTSGRTVEYVQVPPDTWAREPGASWVLVGSDPASIVPIEPSRGR